MAAQDLSVTHCCGEVMPELRHEPACLDSGACPSSALCHAWSGSSQEERCSVLTDI